MEDARSSPILLFLTAQAMKSWVRTGNKAKMKEHVFRIREVELCRHQVSPVFGYHQPLQLRHSVSSGKSEGGEGGRGRGRGDRDERKRAQ